MTHKEIEARVGMTLSTKVVMVLVDGVIYHREDGAWVPYDDAVVSA